MQTIDDYIDAAIEKQGLKSGNELGRQLGGSANNVSQWRTRRSWPSPRTMRRLATMAEMDPEEAVLLLSIWREEDPKTRDLFMHILKTVQGAAKHAASILIVVGAVFMGLNITPVQAQGHNANKTAQGLTNLYIMR